MPNKSQDPKHQDPTHKDTPASPLTSGDEVTLAKSTKHMAAGSTQHAPTKTAKHEDYRYEGSQPQEPAKVSSHNLAAAAHANPPIAPNRAVAADPLEAEPGHPLTTDPTMVPNRAVAADPLETKPGHPLTTADPLMPATDEDEDAPEAPYQSGHGGRSDHAIHGQTTPHVDRTQVSHLPEEPATEQQATDEAAAAHLEP